MHFALEASIGLGVPFVPDILAHSKSVFLAAEPVLVSVPYLFRYSPLIYRSFYYWIFVQLVLELGRFDRYHLVLGNISVVCFVCSILKYEFEMNVMTK